MVFRICEGWRQRIDRSHCWQRSAQAQMVFLQHGPAPVKTVWRSRRGVTPTHLHNCIGKAALGELLGALDEDHNLVLVDVCLDRGLQLRRYPGTCIAHTQHVWLHHEHGAAPDSAAAHPCGISSDIVQPQASELDSTSARCVLSSHTCITHLGPSMLPVLACSTY